MKEDILEQLIEDWYVSQSGWFVKHNIKYRPASIHEDYNSKTDSVHSDIDILAINNRAKGPDSVHVISCKSWQKGFNISEWRAIIEGEAEYKARSAKFEKREGWKSFRELVSEKWIDAFLEMLERETGAREFTYIIAVTKINGDNNEVKELQSSNILKDRFKAHKAIINLEVIDLAKIIADIMQRIQRKGSTPEATQVGRLLQLICAANIEITRR